MWAPRGRVVEDGVGQVRPGAAQLTTIAGILDFKPSKVGCDGSVGMPGLPWLLCGEQTEGG